MIINLLEWDISYQTFMFWCHNSNVPVRRVSITKFSIPDKDFLMFKLSFDKSAKNPTKVYDDDY